MTGKALVGGWRGSKSRTRGALYALVVATHLDAPRGVAFINSHLVVAEAGHVSKAARLMTDAPTR
jgi:hypothetical protein